MRPMRMRLENGCASPPGGEPARASRRPGSAMASAGSPLGSGLSPGVTRAAGSTSGPGGRCTPFRLRFRRREGPEQPTPELPETTQKDILPDRAQGVKVEGQVVQGHEGGRGHLVRQVEVAEVRAAGRTA